MLTGRKCFQSMERNGAEPPRRSSAPRDWPIDPSSGTGSRSRSRSLTPKAISRCARLTRCCLCVSGHRELVSRLLRVRLT